MVLFTRNSRPELRREICGYENLHKTVFFFFEDLFI